MGDDSKLAVGHLLGLALHFFGCLARDGLVSLAAPTGGEGLNEMFNQLGHGDLSPPDCAHL
jgi:hypothetical protein